MSDAKIATNQIIARRSGGYQLSIWNYEFIQSLRSQYVGKPCTGRVKKMKEDVRMMLEEMVNPLYQLEMIDALQRLGLGYQFQDEVKGVLKKIYYCENKLSNKSLYATALEFMLLRQHGYDVHQDVFKKFKDEQENFKACLRDDINGLLYLYEASYLLVEGESILEEARDFTTENLEKYIKQNNCDYLSLLVKHALEVPLHWRMQRLESRWFIEAYEIKQDRNPTLLELSKLDFNIVQATHQDDLKQVSSWSRKIGIPEKLNFARDWVIELFWWSVGLTSDPQYKNSREQLSKVLILTTVIDDLYDVYGTLEELELFTDAVDKWDINALDQLPGYMKVCFLALYNCINEMGYDVLKEQEFHTIPYLKKMWADLCKSFLQEAKWYYSGYTPTLKEYLPNALISVGGPVAFTHAYLSVTNPVTEEGLKFLTNNDDNIIAWSSAIVRLADDLGTSTDEMERGDVPKSIQCYMLETGVSEEEARRHIRYLIRELWTKMNEYGFKNNFFSSTFMEIVMNGARAAQCVYQHGDGHRIQHLECYKNNLISLITQPMSMIIRND